VRFLADVGVSPAIAAWLREQGHDVAHLVERALERLPDPAVFELARQENRIVLTFDLDFAEIATRHADALVATVVFRLINTRVPFVIERLKAVLIHAAADLARPVIVSVEDHQYRVRMLPIGSDT
jgi:predicted nuclease of predicted toxin-antitoxin system